MRPTMIAMRTMVFLLLLVGVSSVVYGLYRAVLFPFDYSNQQALAHTVACSPSVHQDCIRTISAAVVQVTDDGGNEGTLVAQVGYHQVSLDAIQSYDTMARLDVGQQITLLQWRGHVVRVITSTGAFDTTANPSNAVTDDAAFGIAGILLGGFFIWMFGRMALSPIFLALGWRQLATADDRVLDDLQHGIIPAEMPASDRRSGRWMERYAQWDEAHPLLSTLLYMAFTTVAAAWRIWGNAGGWGGPQGFADNPHWPLVLGIAAGLGLVVSLLSRRRLRHTSAAIRETEQLQKRLADVLAWTDGPDKQTALMDIVGSLEAVMNRRGARRRRSPQRPFPGQ